MADPVELYLFRHAQSRMNTQPELIGGRSNSTPLTEHGILQAQLRGADLLHRGVKPDQIFTSPAKRCRDTGRYCLDRMGIVTPLVVIDEIQELSQGGAEGQPRTSIYSQERLAEISRLGKDFKLPGGESMNDVGRRMHAKLTEIAETCDPGERVFVFTHGGAITYLASYVEDWSHARTYAFQKEVGNASESRFDYLNGELTVNYLAHDAV